MCAQVATAWGVLFIPVFRTPPWRPFRVFIFGVMASLAFVPPIAGVFVYGLDEMRLQGGGFYLVAAMLYLFCGIFYGVSLLLTFA